MEKDKKSTPTFPFKTTLDLSLLIKYWEANIESNAYLNVYPKDEILTKIKDAKELHKPIRDPKVLVKHQGLIGFLMSAIFPAATIETKIMAALESFSMKAFYATPGYLHIVPMSDLMAPKTNIVGDDLHTGKVTHACLMILEKFYGVPMENDRPLIFTFQDPETGLDRSYKAIFNHQFIEIVAKGDIPVLSPGEIRTLMANLYDLDFWLGYLKPEIFVFKGFMIFELMDVTEQEMLSSIKYDLLQKDSIISETHFEKIQQKIRAMFRLPELKIGIASFSPNNTISNYDFNMWKSILLQAQNDLECSDYEGSIYELLFVNRKTVIVEDLESLEDKTIIENLLVKAGIRNIAIAPLTYDDELIGLLELGTPYAGNLNPVTAGKIEDVLPMFSIAIKRVMDEAETEVRAIIQEEFTSIHPSIEWRFVEASNNLIHKRAQGEKAQVEQIVFKDVYPIYGLADVRNSSSERNNAIKEDLTDNLNLANNVITGILGYKNMPILDEIKHRIDEEIKKLKSGLYSGDEVGILDFLKNEIVPLFNHFKKEDSTLIPIIEKYEKSLNPQLGVVYNKRKKYEDSMTMINDAISEYLDSEEEHAQNIYPHYFEKYKTDGVEYNIYLGDSLVKDQPFNEIYLRNFRLWQLLKMCEVALKIEDLKPSMPKELEIAQLILAHSEPISIRFRMDEKRFDVDGAYNVRYEIVKKRIDKAFIKGTDERLTQPGKIAIVYAQVKEADEYSKYIHYLQSINYITDEVEYLELEELQGAQGLKAIRIKVNINADKKDYGSEMINNVVESINA